MEKVFAVERFKKSTKRFNGLFMNELDKFFRLRYLLPILLLLVLIACLPIIDYEKNNEFDAVMLQQSQRAEVMQYYRQQLQQTKNAMEEMERNKENYSDSRYQNEMLRLEVRALQLEYILENDIVLDHSNISQSDPTRGRTKGNYLDFSNFYLIYLFALIAVFCTFAVTKEYATKQSLSLFTSPAKRTQIYFAKTALNVLFAFAAVTVYFLITACVITRYPQFEPIVFRFGKEFAGFSAAQAMMLYYCYTLLVAAFSAIFTTTVAFFSKNIYLGVALSVLCLVGIPWILLNWNGDANIARCFPFQNFFFFLSQASFSRALFVMNTPIIAAASFTISSLLLMAVGILGVNKMQHKE